MHILFLLAVSRNFSKWSNTLHHTPGKTGSSGEAAVTFTVGAISFGGIFYLNMNDALE